MEDTLWDKMDLCCSIFEERAHVENFQPLMAEFFHEQVLSYLFQKNTQFLSAPEVDMICDLIEEGWKELQEFIKESPLGKIANIHTILESFHIDFPIVENEPVLIGC